MKHFAQHQGTGPSDQCASTHSVRHALAYLRCNIAEKVTLTELATACATPERTLLKQFRKFVGLSPLAYLFRLRLNAAREELLIADGAAAVGDIAIRCGFTHLGRFATAYRSAFRESPSATRRRMRAPLDFGSPARDGHDVSGLLRHIGVPHEKPSLVIVPLFTETLKENQEARQLTEQLAAALSRMRVGAVTLAHSSRPFTTHAPRPRNAGTQYCLTGRLTQRGERTRVIVRLIDIAADRHLWGDSFDGSADDPFELCDRVADRVLSNVVASITDAEISRARDRGGDRGATVRDLAMRALPLIMDTTVPGTRKAITILTRANELDPTNALAVALLAACHAQLQWRYGTPSSAAACAEATRLSARAAVLDEGDHLVTVARAATAFWVAQPDEADALATRALAQDPTNTWAWERYGMARLFGRGDPEQAIADFNRALRLRGPSLSRINCLIGIAGAHAKAGRLAEASHWRRTALAENPAATWLYVMDAGPALEAGDWARFVADVECVRRGQPELSIAILKDSFHPMDPSVLDALPRAGMPFT
jgi:AraC-like DNA-binding protein/TolB-like protein